MIKLNENGTVRLAGLQLEMDVALYVVEKHYDKCKLDTVITAGTEEFDKTGNLYHSKGSYHPRGYALDFRSREISTALYAQFVKDVQTDLHTLSLAYDVCEEGDHMHVEYDVKKAFILSNGDLI